MNNFKRLSRAATFIALLALFACSASAQTAPLVTKVEPPNWWIGHSINPVRVLIRGRNFQGARVEATGAGLETGLVRVNAAGTYLFVDVRVDAQAKAGRRSLRISAPGGVVETPFEILEPLARGGRFQGFSGDDV
ncbi:MAG TPA: cyclomaltodextrinase N-terminal domain-containing protein, partial [Pyrinomonadaceae bacterium]